MPLTNVTIRPGINKADTPSGAEGQWIDGDFVRFRYGQPEKIGGYTAIGQETIAGPTRAQHTWTDLEGRRYAALGTSKALYIYYEDKFYDITPLATALTSATFTSTNGSNTVTVNKSSHALDIGEYITFTSVTLPGGGATGFTVADFESYTFEILSTPDANSFTIQMKSNESGTGMTAAGSASINPYEEIGPTIQTYGYGWGTGTWSRLTWGSGTTTSSLILDPGSWSLDNFGEQLIATIKDGKTFVWNPGVSNPLEQRATIMTGAPTATRLTITSDRDRHVVHFGTETTIGDNTTQDPMFIRFSDQENFNVYQPTATNTAGTFRLDKGNEIIGAVSGKDYTLVLTDTSAYVIQFVGPPFTFSVRQVGTNCGLIGQNALSYSNGIVFWMSGEGGFFAYDGTVKSIPCEVEDFVFSTTGDNLGINQSSNQLVYAEHNTLYNEINWFYAEFGSTQINRCVVYNYAERVWTTSSLARTSYIDQGLFDLPYATEYNSTSLPNFPIQGITATYGASIYYAHETGTDQVNSSGTTSIDAFIQSGDYDIASRSSALGTQTGVADFRGDGEYIMSVKRFIPDFQVLEGNSKITLLLNDYPNGTAVSSPLGPFTVSSSTDKVDTRARARLVALKIENDAVGETWRYGTLRLDAKPDGRR